MNKPSIHGIAWSQVIAAVLLTALSTCLAAVPEDQASNANLQAIQGQWVPSSRNYEGDPGKFSISDNSIEFDKCGKSTFAIIRNEVRNDRMSNGVDISPKDIRYRDVGIRVPRDSTCGQAIAERIFRFLVSERNPCYASLMIFETDKDLKGNHWIAWGGYLNKSCITKRAADIQPYLGVWRPTSFSEGQNAGSYAISENRLLVEFGGATLTYEVTRHTENAVILHVTGRNPRDAFGDVNSLIFFLETQVIEKSSLPGSVRTEREILRICYLSEFPVLREPQDIRQHCQNTYVR